MRVIAGTFRSCRLAAPPGLSTRPTSDRLRETLFNVLAARIAGAAFLDLYAGSGAVGIEAISRGAAQATFVEQAAPALKVLGANLARLKLTTGFHLRAASVASFLKRLTANATPFDIVFLDPPYDAAREYALALDLLGQASVGILAPAAVVVAEHRSKQPLEDRYAALKRTRLLEQGDAALSFYAAL